LQLFIFCIILNYGMRHCSRGRPRRKETRREEKFDEEGSQAQLRDALFPREQGGRSRQRTLLRTHRTA
jgi:hypothetical protein